MLHGCEIPRVTTETRIGIPSAVMYSTGRSGIAGIGISGATGMPFANGTVCCAELACDAEERGDETLRPGAAPLAVRRSPLHEVPGEERLALGGERHAAHEDAVPRQPDGPRLGRRPEPGRSDG